MSKRLTGLNPLAYMGVEPQMPPNMYMSPISPTSTDVQNFNLGDFWVNTTAQQLWVLVSQARGVAVWIPLFGGAADSFVTDSGTATPSGGALNVVGGAGITTSAAGSTVTITNTEPAGSVTSITAGTGITLTPSPITTTGSVALTVPVIVADGGTGDTSFTAYSVLCGGTSSTNPLQNVSGVGTSGYILTSNGAGTLPTWQPNMGSSGGAFAFIQKQTASSVTSLAFTTGITTAFNNYVLTLDSVTASSTGSDIYLELQISTDGGATYKTTGYQSNGVLTSGLPLTVWVSGLGGPTLIVTGTANLQDFTAGGANNYPGSASDTWTWDFVAASGIGSQLGGIYNTSSTTVNAFRIVLSNGAAFSGRFTLYGLENAGSSGGTLTVDANSGSATPAAGILNIIGTGGITTSGSGSTVTINGSGILSQTVTITLTSAQVKSLQATPHLLLAAQGANTLIVPISFVSFLSYGGSNVFVAPASGSTINGYFTSTNTGNVLISAITSAVSYIQSQNNYQLLPATGSNGGTPSASCIDQPIYVAIDSTAASEITGNAAGDNTLTIRMQYEVLTVPL